MHRCKINFTEREDRRKCRSLVREKYTWCIISDVRDQTVYDLQRRVCNYIQDKRRGLLTDAATPSHACDQCYLPATKRRRKRDICVEKYIKKKTFHTNCYRLTVFC
jgi:hypothetical protein